MIEQMERRNSIANDISSLATIQYKVMLLDLNCALSDLELNEEFKLIQDNIFKINNKLKKELGETYLKCCDIGENI